MPECASDLKVTAQANLVYPKGETAPKIAAPVCSSEKTDLILCTESPKRVGSLRVRMEA